MSEENEHALAEMLVAADRAGTVLAAADLERADLVPPVALAAMRVQAASVSLAGWKISGWKVAVGPRRIPVAAPLVDIATIVEGRVPGYFVRRPQAVEVEIAVELADDLPPRIGRPYVRQEVLERLRSVRVGVEIIAPRIGEGNRAPFPLFLADRLGNVGYVLGPTIGAEMLDLDSGHRFPDLTLRAGGRELFSARPGHPDGDPLTPVLAYANAQNDRLGGLRRGQVVTTGSLCGVIPITTPFRLEIDWTRSFSFDLAEARQGL
ncbi:MAG: 2-keto-4-pentenoate hydratase [Rhizobiaceae bacterium]